MPGSLLPAEVWRNREVFFHDGMRMEVGPCHRRYPVGEAYLQATQRFAPQSKLDDEGNLEGNVAGLPFPPDGIDPKAEDAGIRWAWNVERRYRGAGYAGKFRLVDMPTRAFGGIQTYEGNWFMLLTRHRADLAASDYALPIASDQDWIAGGSFLLTSW